MRVIPVTWNICLGILFLVTGNMAHPQDLEVVGMVTQAVPDKSFIYHEVNEKQDSAQEPTAKGHSIHHTDVLEAKDNGEIIFTLFPLMSTVTVSGGRIHFLDGLDGQKEVKVEGGLARVVGSLESYSVSTDEIVTNTSTTIYEVLAQPRESRVFVYEGAVSVTSKDPRYREESVMVHAGEWVRAREGQRISEPRKFILDKDMADLGSGSSECIYSNCKITDKVQIPSPPVFTPQVLLPPPTNPPGRQ